MYPFVCRRHIRTTAYVVKHACTFQVRLVQDEQRVKACMYLQVRLMQDEQRGQGEGKTKKGSKSEEDEELQWSDEEEEAQTEAVKTKGNSVSAAPVANLAAGLQLGFTPSTAGNPIYSAGANRLRVLPSRPVQLSNCCIFSFWRELIAAMNIFSRKQRPLGLAHGLIDMLVILGWSTVCRGRQCVPITTESLCSTAHHQSRNKSRQTFQADFLGLRAPNLDPVFRTILYLCGKPMCIELSEAWCKFGGWNTTKKAPGNEIAKTYLRVRWWAEDYKSTSCVCDCCGG